MKRGGVKRFEKQIGPFEEREHVLGGVLSGHRVTQLRWKAREDTGLEQKLLHRFWLKIKHFGDKGFLEGRIASGKEGKSLRSLRRGGCSLECEFHQVQSGPPSFQLSVQTLNSRGFQRERERVMEKDGCLFLRETEVGSTYFVQIIAGTKSCQ